MSSVYAAISMSLDGFIAGPEDNADRPLGHGGEILHQWMGSGDRRQIDVLDELFDRLGALIVGRRGFDISERDWGPEPPFRCPVFVLTHRGRPSITRGATSYNFVTGGFENAIVQAKDAAGRKDVGLHGASPVRQALRHGLLDELTIHLVPVLLGGGRRLFDELDGPTIPMDRQHVVAAADVTHLRFRPTR